MARRRKGAPLPGSLGQLIQQYRSSLEFKSLRPNTKRGYLDAINRMGANDGYKLPVKDIRRGHVMWLRDEYAATPAIANRVIQVLSILMNYAMDLEWRDTNPCTRVKHFPKGEFRRWSPEAVEYGTTQIRERFRRAVVLALYTGQREGDLVAMRWDDWDGEGIAVVQEKTGARLWIPCHSALKGELALWRGTRTATTMLTDSRGTPWAANSFATGFGRERDRHPILKGLVFHGLRKTAAAKLAEAGCSTHEIASITGHKTLAMIQHYAKEADQKVNAMAAVVKLENYRPKVR